MGAVDAPRAPSAPIVGHRTVAAPLQQVAGAGGFRVSVTSVNSLNAVAAPAVVPPQAGSGGSYGCKLLPRDVGWALCVRGILRWPQRSHHFGASSHVAERIMPDLSRMQPLHRYFR